MKPVHPSSIAIVSAWRARLTVLKPTFGKRGVLMKRKPDIPAHSYNEFVENVRRPPHNLQLSFDPQFPFVLTRFESMNDIAQADYPHSHDSYEVLYIAEGEGTHVIDFEPHPVHPRTFHFLAKGQIHFWKLTKKLKGYALLFPEEFLGFPSSDIVRAHDFTFFHSVDQAPYLALAQQPLAKITGLLEDIEQEFNDPKARSITVLRAQLHILLTQLHRLYSSTNHQSDESELKNSLVRQFKQLVSEHILENHSVHSYAKTIGISASHLRDSIKATTGYSPGHFIREKLALEAKRRLAHSNATVAEIGYQLGFEDASYFGRFFKREIGMSPKTFRQHIQEKYQIYPE
jgi:AraC-like DNA-binding protein